jgi:dihydrofolate synthase/folylpolyglutamate synthase
MSYSELVDRLQKINIFGGMKLGLQNATALQEKLGFPDRAYPSVHVAGTNGKGSVCHKIAQALKLSGYRTGLYTSPHLCSFRERIRIDGEMISEDDTAKILTSLFDLIHVEGIPATFFEITTFLALTYFAQQQVDAAIIETGLGGRLDSTNIIHPLLSVITSIGMDHMEILGSDPTLIAQEKGGIIKHGVPVVIGPTVPIEPIQLISQEHHSPLTCIQGNFSHYDDENIAIARSALGQLSRHFQIPPDAIEKGLQALPPCRMELIKGMPLIILDVAHNPQGIDRLFASIQARFPDRTLSLLFGLSKNKDLQECLKSIAGKGSHYHIVEATNGRGAARECIREELTRHSLSPPTISVHETIIDGVAAAKESARQNDNILVVFGSFFIMRDARKALGFHDTCDSDEMNERLVEKSCQVNRGRL